jgi:hypothetical protein
LKNKDVNQTIHCMLKMLTHLYLDYNINSLDIHYLNKQVNYQYILKYQFHLNFIIPIIFNFVKLFNLYFIDLL